MWNREYFCWSTCNWWFWANQTACSTWNSVEIHKAAMWDFVELSWPWQNRYCLDWMSLFPVGLVLFDAFCPFSCSRELAIYLSWLIWTSWRFQLHRLLTTCTACWPIEFEQSVCSGPTSLWLFCESACPQPSFCLSLFGCFRTLGNWSWAGNCFSFGFLGGLVVLFFSTSLCLFSPRFRLLFFCFIRFCYRDALNYDWSFWSGSKYAHLSHQETEKPRC